MKEKGIPQFNIAVVGVRGVGKTSLVQRFVSNSFMPGYTPTHSIKKYTKVFDLKENRSADPQMVILQIYDLFPSDHELLIEDKQKLNHVERHKATMMAEDYETLLRNAARWNRSFEEQEMQDGFPRKNLKVAIHAYLFLVSPQNPQSFSMAMNQYTMVKKYEHQYLRHAGENPFYTKKFLIVTKMDNHDKRFHPQKVFEQGAEEIKFFNRIPITQRYEVSSLSNHHIHKVFKAVSYQLLNEKQQLARYLERRLKSSKMKSKIKGETQDSGKKGYWCCSGRAGPQKMTLANLEKDEGDDEEDEENPAGDGDDNSSGYIKSATSKKPAKSEKSSRCFIL